MDSIRSVEPMWFFAGIVLIVIGAFWWAAEPGLWSGLVVGTGALWMAMAILGALLREGR